MEKSIYSEVKTIKLDKFRVATYVVISPDPEDMALAYMDEWAEKSGLTRAAGYKKKRIGWDFFNVTEEQREVYGMRGYVAAYALPDGFEPKYGNVKILEINADTYATLTITDPHSDSFVKIPEGYRILMDYAKTVSCEDRYAFEEEYDKDGIHYMNIFVPMN